MNSRDSQVNQDTGTPQDAQISNEDAMSPIMDSQSPVLDMGFEDAAVTEDIGGIIDDAGSIADTGQAACGCASDEYCEFSARFSCSEPGTCMQRPDACPENIDPVCGCDKKNYSNECHAHAAGADISHEGDCDCRDLGCAAGQWCQLCRTQTGAAYVCLPQGAMC